MGTSARNQSGTLPVTLLTGHSFIKWLERYMDSEYQDIKPNKVLNVSHLTEIKLRGFPGEVTLGYLNNRMKDLPKADVILDIGCNDIDSNKNDSDPIVAAACAAEIVKIFVTKLGAKCVIACKATLRTPRWRIRFVEQHKVNENIKAFNKHLEKEINTIQRAETHEHSEMLELTDSQWTRDELHPYGLGMIRYTQSIRRAVVKALKMAEKKL